MNKLNIKSFALAAGISWGLYMLLLGLISADGYAVGLVHAISTLYLGFKPGFLVAL